MSSSETEPAPSFAPTTDDPLTAEEAFARLQTDLTDFPTAVDLVVANDQPDPVGRSWSFDWAAKRFVKPTGALGPKATYGNETLSEWIEKALQTARGAHPVHPEEYGLLQPQGLLVGARTGSVPPDLEKRVSDTLTFHPHITAVESFSYEYDPDDEFLGVSFLIVLGDDTTLEMTNVRTSLAL